MARAHRNLDRKKEATGAWGEERKRWTAAPRKREVQLYRPVSSQRRDTDTLIFPDLWNNKLYVIYMFVNWTEMHRFHLWISRSLSLFSVYHLGGHMLIFCPSSQRLQCGFWGTSAHPWGPLVPFEPPYCRNHSHWRVLGGLQLQWGPTCSIPHCLGHTAGQSMQICLKMAKKNSVMLLLIKKKLAHCSLQAQLLNLYFL